MHAWRRVWIETDCYSVYCYLVKESRSVVSFGAILDSCFELAYLFSSLSFSDRDSVSLRETLFLIS